MRIRRKLIVLHTVFSVSLAVILLLAIRAPVERLAMAGKERASLLALAEGSAELGVDGITLYRGSPSETDLSAEMSAEVRRAGGEAIYFESGPLGPLAARYDTETGEFVSAVSNSIAGKKAVNDLYLYVTISLLAVYGLIVLVLELFVLPSQVYRPIERLRVADEAVQRGMREAELIPEDQIGNDELGEIMRSRNASIEKLRDQESRLAETFDELERIATELKRKNHLLENAKRNLADQDRLASLGMMSAGVAHEINTPLAVLKGCVEELESKQSAPSPARVALMLRVMQRLERLSESLLDFARVRPPAYTPMRVREALAEAWTLVSIDRGSSGVGFENAVDPFLSIPADSDRMIQVFVNVLRNAVDAMEESPPSARSIRVSAEARERDGGEWLSIVIADTGPGIAAEMLSRMFEPFASTRLDADGTGLGLAVAEGIVREHRGVLLVRNQAAPQTGAIFEIVLPFDPQQAQEARPGEEPQETEEPEQPAEPGDPVDPGEAGEPEQGLHADYDDTHPTPEQPET